MNPVSEDLGVLFCMEVKSNQAVACVFLSEPFTRSLKEFITSAFKLWIWLSFRKYDHPAHVDADFLGRPTDAILIGKVHDTCVNLKKTSMAPSPSTALVIADAHNYIPTVWVKGLAQNPLCPFPIDLPLNSAKVIDVPCVFNYE